MKNIMLKTFSTSLICLLSIGFANAAEHKTKAKKAEPQNIETQLELKACSKKKEGEWVSYSYKGVTFNGSCQPNANGKLQFTPPMPK